MIRKEQQNVWWIVAGEVEDPQHSGLVRLSVARACKDNFAQLRQRVWKWYREQAGRVELNAGAKLVLWAMVERYRYETMSSHDAVSYYARMVGMNRKSVGRAVQELIEHNIIWCVLEDEKVRLRRSKAGGRKHFLLVGLGDLLIKEDT